MEAINVDEILKLREEQKGKPMEKKKPCKTCKKKQEEIVITNPEPLPTMDYIPDANDIQLAFAELTSFKGIQEDKKEFISKVYKAIFNEDLVFDCGSCVSTQARKFSNYITNVLKLTV